MKLSNEVSSEIVRQEMAMFMTFGWPAGDIARHVEDLMSGRPVRIVPVDAISDCTKKAFESVLAVLRSEGAVISETMDDVAVTYTLEEK
jgi:hypothetical protein